MYLSSFELVKPTANTTVDNVEQAYADVSCRATLIVPNGLSDEHSAIINERLESSLHMRLKLTEPNEQRSSLRTDLEKNRRQTRFKQLGSSETTEKARVKRSVTSTKALLYEMEITEGPIRVFEDNFREGLNASCRLSLKDFDNTFAFNSVIDDTVFVAATSPGNSAAVVFGRDRIFFNFVLLFVLVLFTTRSINV